MNHKCPTSNCRESYEELPDLRDHLLNDHGLTLRRAKTVMFGVVGSE